ncbi:insulinase family protein [Selenomonas sp. TAMA-11512]|uniref:insulinase family protein n=1 Tax=Selenomonas sp. TAMA-11512 TaxID=3095337 RepID=UPI003093922A|nr:insulinase family protein [Selenomonas sp. TAMA-11512]
MELQELKHGFRLLEKKEIAEIDATAYTFSHEKTGARLLYLATEDDNKVFSISFRTPPEDDTGAAHIVEHSVLCGSRKYPLKEPFVELVKGSLNTFLNAMTFPDKTMYPVASRNDKDFKNLMDVYLDAVFYPAMREQKEILMQEGWRYEIEHPEEPLRYSGVVFNEMKGALSSPEDLLENHTMRMLFPDTPYAKESGGNPDAIPALTYEDFTAFHSRYYHPSNSYIFLYGAMDIEERLAYLDREYLSAFDAIEPNSAIAYQPAFSAPKQLEEVYPIGEEEEPAGKTFLSLSMVTGRTGETETNLAMSVLTHTLLQTEAAPLRKALVDAELGMDVVSVYEDGIQEPYLSITIPGSDPEKADRFCEVVETTLKKITAEGLDASLLEASLNVLEFKLREADFGTYPKGLIYNIKLMGTWLYDGDPTVNLFYEDLLAKLREEIQTGYFEKLIEEKILKNNHRVRITLKPDRQYANRKAKALEEELAAVKSRLSAAEVEEIIELNRALKKRQQEEETPEALATIPLLSRSDIKREVEKLPLDVRALDGNKVLFSDEATHKIAYLTLYFGVKHIAQEELPYLYLIEELIGAVHTKESDYGTLSKRMNLHTGGIKYDLTANTRSDEPTSFWPFFKIKAKALVGKLPQLFELLTEILTESRFDDKKRVKELVVQAISSIEMSMLRSSQQVMAGRLASYILPSAAYNEAGGLPFYKFLKELNENFDSRFDELRDKLTNLLPLIFHQENLMYGVTLREKYYESFLRAAKPFQEALPSADYREAAYHFPLEAKNEGLTSSSRVQYVGKAANYRKLGYTYTGSMRVLETILRYDYFWTKIRVQGGAYGAFTQFTKSGILLFGSYRDPNLTETLQTFDATSDYLKTFDVSEREMDKFVIGTMSGVDMPLTPQMRGARAQESYLLGVTEEERQKTRDEILAACQADIRALAPLVEDSMAENNMCVFGNEVVLKEHAELFGTLVPVMS